MEHWREIEGYEGYYEVSDLGNVRSVDRVVRKSNGVMQPRCGKTMPLKEDKDGYLVVKLSRDGVSKLYAVHRLVANAFIEHNDNAGEVNHIDFDRKNNAVFNLEWVTHRDNVRYTVDNNRHVSQRDLRGSNNPNYRNTTLHERYKNDKAYALEKQSRKGASNGRATSVTAMSPDGMEKKFSTLSECASFLIDSSVPRSSNISNVSTKISEAAKTGTTYYGYKFSI